MHVPKDPRIFNNPNKPRDIDIVFSGSYGLGREERQNTLLHLINNGIALVHGGSEGRDHFTTEEYADRYKRSKLALSFSKAHGINVVNARPFEAMSCGAMLLEQESPELAKLFEEGKEYVMWKTNDDLLEKVRYYLEHEDERNAIALAGQKKVEQLYSAKKFWEEVLK
jgi:glycosyltransferase involved in cell wall biosynthesis